MPKQPIINPNILILEGLWSDTRDALNAAGANTREESPWDWVGVEEELLSGNYNGMVLTGGSDVNPELYTDAPVSPYVYGIDDLRDAVELRALDIAQTLNIPVLGICRGSQIMTVHRGGQLVQHIGEDHRSSSHRVYAAPDCSTFKRACRGREMMVTSLHHQCVRRPGRGMRIGSYAHDSTPESVESKDGLWLGVQFHPELEAFNNGQAFAIFQWLVDQAARHAGGRAPTTRFRDVRRAYLEAKYDFTPSSAPGPDFDDDALWYHGGGEAEFPSATTASPPKKSRQAGDAAIPSMRAALNEGILSDGSVTTRALVAAIEKSTGSGDFNADYQAKLHAELLICPTCAMEFDLIEDRDDHIEQIHHGWVTPPFRGVETRFPEMSAAPTAHPSWELSCTCIGREEPCTTCPYWEQDKALRGEVIEGTAVELTDDYLEDRIH